jgi:hypothetical protein
MKSNLKDLNSMYTPSVDYLRSFAFLSMTIAMELALNGRALFVRIPR